MKDKIGTDDIPKVPDCLAWLFPYKIKTLPISTRYSVIYYLLQNKISLTFINWLFQGTRGMDRADLMGKITLEILIVTIYMLTVDGSLGYKIPMALIVGHTVNWLINTHFWVFGRFLGITHTSPKRFLPYIHKVVSRVNKDSSIPIVIVIGSISRNQQFKATSDVDIMFIKGTGFQNAVNAILVTMRERVIAFLCRFPLHLELYDGIESMNKHRADEIPVVLKDIGEEAKDWYNKKGRAITAIDDYEGRSQI